MTKLINTSITRRPLVASTELSKQNANNLLTIEVISQIFVDHQMRFCRNNRAYISPSISYTILAIEQSEHLRAIHEQTVFEAFQRLVVSISGENFKGRNSQIIVALYEFLTFTEAYGWQPLFFNVAEQMAPILRSQGLKVVKQHFQESEFRYLAYRKPIFALSDFADSDEL